MTQRQLRLFELDERWPAYATRRAITGMKMEVQENGLETNTVSIER